MKKRKPRYPLPCEYRQTKECKLSDQGGEYTVPHKGADPVQVVLAQQIDEEMNPSKYDGDIERDYIEEAKIEIVDKVTKHFQDMVFEIICEEMSNKRVFQSQNYLTEAGMEEFEEQFFEFYHEHHGEIMFKVMKNITN